jgi:hypothetical protein
LLKQ